MYTLRNKNVKNMTKVPRTLSKNNKFNKATSELLPESCLRSPSEILNPPKLLFNSRKQTTTATTTAAAITAAKTSTTTTGTTGITGTTGTTTTMQASEMEKNLPANEPNQLSAQHEELVRFISDSWEELMKYKEANNKTECDKNNPDTNSDGVGEIGTEAYMKSAGDSLPLCIEYVEEDDESLKNFKPFDLEGFWINHIMESLLKDS